MLVVIPTLFRHLYDLSSYLGYEILVGTSSNYLLLCCFSWDMLSCFKVTPADKSFKAWPTGHLSSFDHWPLSLTLRWPLLTYRAPPLLPTTSNQLTQSVSFLLWTPLAMHWPLTSLFPTPNIPSWGIWHNIFWVLDASPTTPVTTCYDDLV